MRGEEGGGVIFDDEHGMDLGRGGVCVRPRRTRRDDKGICIINGGGA